MPLPGSELPNEAPVASASASCDGLTCDFFGAGSSDTDGTIASYAWGFGDGQFGTGKTATHTYRSDGNYTVTLTVTDDDGATGSTSTTVPVAAPPPPPDPPADPVAFRAETSLHKYSATHTLTVPASVQEGDALRLFTNVNDSAPTISDLPGWQDLDHFVAGRLQTGPGTAWPDPTTQARR